MKEFLYFDKEKLSPEDFNRSLMFGEGAFETFRFKQKLPVFIDRHLQRLKSTCKFLDIKYPGDFYIETTVDKEKITGFLRGLYAEAQQLETETSE